MNQAAREAAAMIRTGALPSYAIGRAARHNGETASDVARELRTARDRQRAERAAAGREQNVVGWGWA